MAKTKDKSIDEPETFAVTESPAAVEPYPDDAATGDAPAIAAGPATLSAVAADPNAEPTAFDPGGDIQTDFRTAVVGREIVVTRWALAPVSEQYANANSYGLFGVLGFYFADDTERKPRFTTNGSQRIVESIHAAIVAGDKLPVKATVVVFQTRGGFTGYRFSRPGETIR